MSKTVSKAAGEVGVDGVVYRQGGFVHKTFREGDVPDNYVSLHEMIEADREADRKAGRDKIDPEEARARTIKYAKKIVADNWLIFDLLAER